MNGLGAALAWSSFQVTLVALLALVLERVASRQGPRAGSWVATTSLSFVIVLFPLAFCPLPSLLTWRYSGSFGRPGQGASDGTSTGQRALAAVSTSIPAISDSRGAAGDRGSRWTDLMRRLRVSQTWGASSIQGGNPVLARAWCIVALAGTSCCLVRLLIGLWGVRDCRRKSVAINDSDVLALIDSMRTNLGVTTCIEVRELPGLALSTAAAVGWRRPLVLLPADWRRWNDRERRAVLAHEVAHIARADYAAGVVARLGLAIHFYHPLVHWLVGRLQLQQELAADADGARLAGGRQTYLLALSHLALGTERGRPAWPAIAFLRTKGHLIRRIQVLKEQIPAKHGSMPAAARAVTIALLAAIGLGTAALRGPSLVHGAEGPTGTDKSISNPVTTVSKNSNGQPFDLTYLPSKAVGFVVFKPAAISQLPACKPQLDWLNGLITKEFSVGMPKIETIEQVMIEFSVKSRDTKKKQPGRIMEGAIVLRTVEDFDWKSAIKAIYKRLDKIDLDLVEVHLDGKVYYKSAKSNYPRPFGPDSFYFPDARTIVWDYENNLRQLIAQVPRTGTAFVAGGDWRKVDGGLIAVAIDNRDQRWKLDANTDKPDDLPIAPLLQQASRWVLGIDYAQSLTLHAIATCETEARGQALARMAESLLEGWRVALGQAKTSPPKGVEDEIEAGATHLANEFVQASIVHCDGLAVDIRATSHLGADTLIKFILAGAG
jgi:beta-lactamase regulating signal transducer with metallopeptidase domain